MLTNTKLNSPGIRGTNQATTDPQSYLRHARVNSIKFFYSLKAACIFRTLIADFHFILVTNVDEWEFEVSNNWHERDARASEGTF